MPEPLKNLFNPQIIDAMGTHLERASPGFDKAGFVQIASKGLDALELKERSAQIQAALEATLPGDFREACAAMLGSLSPKTDEDWKADDVFKLGVSGWAVMPMAEVVASRGLSDFDYAMGVLAEMTKRFTSEFAVRPFFIADPKRAIAIAENWATSNNFHMRRLASEGSRPRLPWGLRLSCFVADPSPLIPLLTALRDDPSEYVRRSVANSLNDIAKDHPAVVAQIAAEWMADAAPARERLIRRACRSLVKAGDAATLAALGYGPPQVTASPVRLETPSVALGGALRFAAAITSTSTSAQRLIVDYVIHHRKANGRTTPKTFKWKTMELSPGETAHLAKTHKIKPITTRVYHAGAHGVELQINGETFGATAFELTI